MRNKICGIAIITKVMLAALLLLTPNISQSQTRQLLQRTYAVEDWEGPRFYSSNTLNGMRVIDSGYLLLGMQSLVDTPYYTEDHSLYICRLDLAGDTVWCKRFPSPYKDSGMYVHLGLYGGLSSPLLWDLGDGHFGFLSHAFFFGDSSRLAFRKIVLNEFDLNGDVVLQKVILDSPAFRSFAVNAYAYSKDDSTYILGLQQSPEHWDSMRRLNSSIVKIRRDGDVVWQTSIHDYDRDTSQVRGGGMAFLDVKRDVSGGAIVGGFGRLAQYLIPGKTGQHNLFTRVDAHGRVLWQRHYRPNDYKVMLYYWTPTEFLPNGNHWFSVDAALTPEFPPGHDYAGLQSTYVQYFGECEPNGDTVWTSTFAYPMYGNEDYKDMDYKMQTNTGGLFYLDGYMYAVNRVYRAGRNCHALVKFDLRGHVQWYREYAYNFNYDDGYIHNIQKTPEGYLAIGVNAITGRPPYNPVVAWLLVLDSTGCLLPGCDTIDTMWTAKVGIIEADQQTLEVAIYPNPGSRDLYIDGGQELYVIQIISMEGRMMHQTAAVSGRQHINIHNYPSGSYVVKIKRGSQERSHQFIKTD
jgi:hypothetical protein